MKRTDILLRESDIRQWCKEGLSKFEICIRLNCKPETLNKYLKLMQIEYKGRQDWAKNIQFLEKYISYEEYVQRGRVKRGQLKKVLLRQGLKEYRCENCGLTTWQNKTIPLELHHKDGNQANIALDNIQLLCPNCHALTENYGCKKLNKTYFCPICGNQVKHKGSRCKKCAAIERMDKQGRKRPTKAILLESLSKTQNFCELGRIFGVSDNAIRQWCKYYNIPIQKEVLKNYIANK